MSNVIETFEKSELLDLIGLELGGGNYHLAEGLLDHARALEARNRELVEMLRKHQWSGQEFCNECTAHEWSGHSKDCQLAKLIGGEK